MDSSIHCDPCERVILFKVSLLFERKSEYGTFVFPGFLINEGRYYQNRITVA